MLINVGTNVERRMFSSLRLSLLYVLGISLLECSSFERVSVEMFWGYFVEESVFVGFSFETF